MVREQAHEKISQLSVCEKKASVAKFWKQITFVQMETCCHAVMLFKVLV
jgi:hypothetical protein